MTENIKSQVQILRNDGYLDVAAIIEWQDSHFNLAKEQEHMSEYAATNNSGNPLVREQFRALWTAYCFHADRLLDTKPYDDDLVLVWNRMEDAGQTRGWKNFDDFGNFMCILLV